MLGSALEEAGNWLDLPPTPAQRRAAWLISIGVFVVLVGLSPFFNTPLTELNALFPALDAIVLVCSAVTATLLFAQFSISNSRRLFILANGYVFCVLIIVPHALTIAGAFSPAGLLGANVQTGSWLYIFWHFGFAVSLLLYALTPRDSNIPPAAPAPVARAIIVSGVAVALVVCALTWLSTAGAALLPAIVTDTTRISRFVVYPITLTILLFVSVLAVLWRRRRDSLVDQWIIVLAWVSILELAVSGLFPTIRFSLGFYAGRMLSLFTTSIILIILLAETTVLYARVARSNLLLRRERDNKLMSLDAVASSISHEIRQPLGAITASTEAALIYIEKEIPDIQSARSTLKEIIIYANHINGVLQGVRAIFGTSNRELAQVNVNDLALEALRVFKAQLSESGVSVQLQLSSELRPVPGHKDQLQEVINNLLHNAIDAMRGNEAGRRTLTLKTENESEKAIAVEIADSGPGITPTVRSKIFDPFVSTKPGGMGLGLAICQTIVERHSGRISVAAAHPSGSIFRVVLLN